MRKLLLSVTCLACAFPAVLAAQTDKALIAYFTLLETPPGALPPTLSMPMVNRPMTNTDVSLRYGYTSLSGVSLHTIGLTLGVPAGTKSAIGLTAGYQGVSCDGGGCDGHFVASAKAEGRLSSSPLGTTPNSPVLNVGLNGEFGFGKPSGGSLYSITAGVPIALVASSPTLRIAPFLTPGFGFGLAHGNGDSENGTRFLLGGGLTIQNVQNAIAVNLAFQKIFIDQGDTMVGLGVSFGVK